MSEDGSDPARERDGRFLEAGIDFESANAARMYDYYLGGAHNFAVDREQADAVIAAQPHVVYIARSNRSFMGRVVRWCLERGVDQFLDLGSGVPTVGNLHEIAHQHNPAARVAYVDFEPVAVASAAAIIEQLGDVPITITRADARDPDGVLAASGVAGLLDFDRPVAVLAVALLPFIGTDIPTLLGSYIRAVAPGSVLALSYSTEDHSDSAVADQMRGMRDAYATSATPLYLHDHAEIRRALAGVELVPPGLVDIVDWPTPGVAEPSSMYGAVGVVP